MKRITLIFGVCCLPGLLGCDSSHPVPKPPSEPSTPAERDIAANSLKGEERIKLVTENWLFTAKEQGGKELKAVRSWRVLDVRTGAFNAPGAGGLGIVGERGFIVRVVVDHSDEHGRPVSFEYDFCFRTFWTNTDPDYTSTNPSTIVRR